VPTPLQEGDTISLGLNASDFQTARQVAGHQRKLGSGTAAPWTAARCRSSAHRPERPRRFIADSKSCRSSHGAGRQGGHQCPHRLHRAQPGRDPGALRHRARQPVGHHQHHPGHQPAQCPLGRPDRGGQKADIQIKQEPGNIINCRPPQLADVVRALNALGATPQDLLAILQAIKAAGALRAELEVI
jgi:flagellar P-ring protein precursor FlgI